MNGITAFIDASNVYGSDEETADKLRTHTGGQLVTYGDNLLPKLPNDDGDLEFTAGDVRCLENSGLSALHTVFVREHNALASGLAALEPHLDDEKWYQGARRIVIAEMQNIIYGQWLPEVLGPNNMGDLALDHASVYNPSIDPSITNEFATAAFRFGHSMAEDFVHFHHLMTNAMDGHYRLMDNFFNTTVYENKMAAVLNGMANQQAQSNDRAVVTDVRDNLFKNVGLPGSDLVARNIQRGRDHGLAGYNDYRELQGLPRACSWDNAPNEIPSGLWTKLSKLYDEPSDIDLFTAGLAETPMPGAHVGPTFGWIIKQQFRVCIQNMNLLIPLNYQIFYSRLSSLVTGFSSLTSTATLSPSLRLKSPRSRTGSWPISSATTQALTASRTSGPMCSTSPTNPPTAAARATSCLWNSSIINNFAFSLVCTYSFSDK